jgi:uncharacterized protein GlcG (DUF336 family)
MTYQKQSISLVSARGAVAASIDAVGANDGPIAVAVADENGDPIFMSRMDGTAAADVRLAMRKAYTAAFIGRDTKSYLAQITEDGRTLADWADPMMTSLLGGLTLKAGGRVVGGIGVSGNGAERDEALADIGMKAMGLDS